MKEHKSHTERRPPTEIVFVLRLRAGDNGWWGQVRRVDQPQAQYVRDIAAITALLQQHWEAQYSIESLDPETEQSWRFMERKVETTETLWKRR